MEVNSNSFFPFRPKTEEKDAKQAAELCSFKKFPFSPPLLAAQIIFLESTNTLILYFYRSGE
jgi:hypothetical protein